MSDTMLALPSGAGSGTSAESRRTTLPLAATAAGAAALLVVGGLIAAYLALRSNVDTWPPKDVEFDNYTAVTLVVTLLLSMATIQWAASALNNEFRGHALAAFALTMVLGVAFLNGLYYLISKLPFEAGDSPYATVVYAMTFVVFVEVLAALVCTFLTFLRAAGHQLGVTNMQLMRAAAVLWHSSALAWFAVFYTIYITK